MLVIERKAGESFRLTRSEEQITVTITQLRGGRARVGIEAAKDWKIDRIDNVNTDGVAGTEASLNKEESE